MDLLDPDGDGTSEPTDDGSPEVLEPGSALLELVDAGWLPPPGFWDDRTTQPSVFEDRAVVRAAARRVRAEGEQWHRRSELARERSRALALQSEELLAARSTPAAGDERGGDRIAVARTRSEARADIYRSVGMLMLHHRCGEPEAWAVLREASQRSNRKVRDIAAVMIAQVSAGNGLPDDIAGLLAATPVAGSQR